MTTTAYSNTAARLPALPSVSVADTSLQRFLNAVRENIEVRTGARGDRFERAITLRDLVQLGLVDERSGTGPSARLMSGGGATPSSQSNGGVVVQTGTKYTTLDFETFASSIINSRMFKSLTSSLSDASRFDMMSERVRQALLRDIAAEAKQRGADVRRMEEKIQSATESTAIAIQEVTASLGASVAGVRETAFATATETKATAGVVTQVTAALGDPDTFLGAGVTLEQAMFGIADASEGLYGQYTVKMNAAGHAAGFGLAIEANGDNDATSAFIIAADKFAIVDATETLADPLNPPADRIPFGVDTVEDVIFINGNVRIGNATGIPISEAASGVIVEWSVNGSTSWHSTFASGDKYARWKVGAAGAWQGPFQVVGEDGAAGAAGNYVSFIFRRSATQPATPTGNTPASWFDSPPAANGNPLWASIGTKTAAGVLVGSWSTPVQIEGAAGAAGTRGSRTWYENHSSYTASYTFGGNSAGAASYAAKATSVVSADGAGSPIKGDTLVFTNGTNYTYTIVHNGSAWVAPGVVIDGNLLVTGSITTTHLASSVSLSTSGYVYAAGNSTYSITDPNGSSTSGTASIFGNGSMTAKYGMVGYTSTSGGAGVYGYNANGTNGPGVAGRGILGVWGVATSDSGAGGYFQSYSGNGRAVEAVGYIHATGHIHADSYVKSSYYIETPDIILGQTPTTGGATATFAGNNKPGGASTNTWIVIQTNAGLRYIPCWA